MKFDKIEIQLEIARAGPIGHLLFKLRLELTKFLKNRTNKLKIEMLSRNITRESK